MRMLRWSLGITRLDHINIENTVVRDKMAVAPITDKIAEARLKLLGHIKRSDTESVPSCFRYPGTDLEGTPRNAGWTT